MVISDYLNKGKKTKIMDPQFTPLSINDSFQFGCNPDVPCFNQCCYDLNQPLTPYDVLCLKGCLGLSSSRFLAQYTTEHMGPETGLPVVSLRPAGPFDLRCPFVTDAGCRVYESRPSSCRAYPLVRIASRNRKTKALTEQYLLLKEAHCLGCNQQQTQTVSRWIETQGLSLYNQINDGMMELISLKNRLRPGPLDHKSRRLFHLACYDLDAFKEQIVEKRGPDDLNVDIDHYNRAEQDDTALLWLGFKWVRRILFQTD